MSTIYHELVTKSTNRKVNTRAVAQSVNCYLEYNEDIPCQRSIEGIKERVVIGSRTGNCQGIYVPSVGLKKNSYRPDLFIVYNGTVYRIDAVTEQPEAIAHVINSAQVKFAESAGERDFLLIVDGYNMFAYDLKEGGSAQRVPLPHPIDDETRDLQPSSISVVSGTVVINDKLSSYAYYSAPYALSNTRLVFAIDENGNVQYEADGITVKQWMLTDDGKYEYDSTTKQKGALVDSTTIFDYLFYDSYGTQQYFNAESNSDRVNGLFAQGSNLVMFGTSSIEFWQRSAQDDYSPFTRVSYSSNSEHGLLSPNSIACSASTIYFLSQGDATGACVMAINGTQLKKVSPVWVDELIKSTVNIENAVGYSYAINSHNFYLLELDDKTIVYDSSNDTWHIRQSRNKYSGTLENYHVRYVGQWKNSLVAGNRMFATLYTLDPEYYYEDYNDGFKLPLFRQRTSPVLYVNYVQFILNQLNIEWNTGYATDYNMQPKILLECSTDAGHTFGNIIEAYGGGRGEYGYRTRFLNLGLTRLAVIRLTYTEPTAFYLTDASIVATPTKQMI